MRRTHRPAMELEELNAFTKTERDIPRSEVPKLKALLEQFEVQDGGFCIAMDPIREKSWLGQTPQL